MAANCYFIAGTLSTQAGRMADDSDILWVRTSSDTWNQIQAYHAFTDKATGFLLGYSIGASAPVSGTATFTPINGGSAITYDSLLHNATAGANNGNLDDINSAKTYDLSSIPPNQMNAIVGNLQSQFDDRGIEWRYGTATLAFPAV